MTLASTLEYPSLRSSGSTVEYERPEIGDETIDENDDGINDNMLDVPAEIDARITSMALGKVVSSSVSYPIDFEFLSCNMRRFS